ncbi:MAG: acyl-CoA thioesterase [Anaerolineae bacterium]
MLLQDTLPKVLESTATIRFHDCDPFRHLNNARYIDYFMNAREDHLAQYYDFRIFDVAQQTGYGWVVTKTQIAYMSPAMMQEQVIIRTQLIHMSENNLVVEGVMLNAAGKRIKAASWIEFTYVNLGTGRTAQHDDDLMTLFRTVVVSDAYAVPFDERMNQLRAEFRKPAAEAAPEPTL